MGASPDERLAGTNRFKETGRIEDRDFVADRYPAEKLRRTATPSKPMSRLPLPQPMRPPPTTGQLAVRELVQANLAIFEMRHVPRTGWFEMAKALKQVLAADARVTNDPVTGKRLGYTTYAQSYLVYLQEVGKLEERHKLITPDLPVWNFIYTRGWGRVASDKEAPPAYLLGEKYGSTASVLFGLAQRKSIETSDWDLFFYPEEQILTTASGGEHRTLAHMLWGQSPPEYLEVDVYHTTGRTDSELNQALLFFESILPQNINTHGLAIQDFEQAKGLHLSTPPEDRMLIASFYSVHREDWTVSKELRGFQLMRRCMLEFEKRRGMLKQFVSANTTKRRHLSETDNFFTWLLKQHESTGQQ
jgi:hypothetical protein